MDDHPLNLAHQQYRRAEAHMKNNRYDEAMQCHQNAAELLLDAMKSTSSTFALESITLQHSYHLKQKDIIKCKKEQYARVKKAMENIKCLGIDPSLNVGDSDHNKLQIEIYKNLNESENLLSLLTDKGKSNETQTIIKDLIPEGRKTEKNQQTVVEELQILSQSLHSLVEQLVLQVEVLKDENNTLKDKLSYLEKERMKYLNISTTADFNFACDVPSNKTGTERDQNPSTILNLMDIEKLALKDGNQ
ncbi:nuclear receptor-binding factor 2-like [Aricia agestis]|uniref:nuclear receptor-binding factor 2-like n=1 Tax=Aricia agestis TaxID=91739 RepID=UPI001C20229E|nr:nuclear receptor-binding factor 2-like [Aricia agestis]